MRFRREYAVCVFAAAAFRITAGFAEDVHLRAPGEDIAQIHMIRNIFSNVLVMNVAGRKLNVNRISQCVRHHAGEKPRRAARVAPETLCGTLICMFFSFIRANKSSPVFSAESQRRKSQHGQTILPRYLSPVKFCHEIGFNPRLPP